MKLVFSACGSETVQSHNKAGSLGSGCFLSVKPCHSNGNNDFYGCTVNSQKGINTVLLRGFPINKCHTVFLTYETNAVLLFLRK